MFRSEEMSLAQVFLQTEVAFGSIRDLGELGLVQFQDLNPETNAFNRKFVNEVRRCEEMERRIRYVQKEVLRAGLDLSQVERNSECPMPRDMIDIEASLETMESELREVESNYEVLQKSRLELCELYQVLVKANSFLKEKPDPDTLGDSAFHGGPVEMHTALKLGFKAGVINRERLPAFERILWRACRGFVLLRFTAADDCLQDPVTGEKVSKDVFVIFFQGEKLKNLANKICEGFRATMYPCPDSTAERSKILSNVTTRLEDLRSILEETQQHRMRVLTLARENLPTWIIRVHMMKAVYHVLNKCNVDVTQKCIIAEIWCPSADLDIVRHSLHKSTEKAGSTVPSILNCMSTTKEPPTFNRTNKFTKGFQVIVDAYGVGCYREVNPALYTIITFPFLFAVMFGDIGHGIIMALFALTLVFNEKKLEANKGANEIFDTFIGGRYIILLMGLFSIYTGLIYNDCFSKSFNIFGSTWNVNAMFINGSWPNKTFMENNVLQLDPVVKDVFNGPYPFGIDPIWNLSPNKLTFLNSFKMKMSVILGVIHMTIGICLSLVNHIYFNNKMNIFLEFVPEIIFILALFGYLVALIIFKWIVCKSADSKDSQSLLIAFINMFMFDNSGAKLYSGQGDVQYFLVVIALICVPWMLLVKPIILCVNHNKKERKSMVFQYSKDQDAILTDPDYATLSSSSSMDMNDTPEETFDAGDIFVHQAIHTIEYCLGCISNTASYLRLWALSLAHAQLSEVLWNLLLNIAFTSTTSYAGIVPVVIIFFCFAVLTIAILLVMEGLSAFLHALRLHWVEFQNKFYTGAGYLFTPFTFKISEDEDRN